MTDHLSHLKLSVVESGAKIAWLTARWQELDRECKRLISNADAHKKDVRGISSFLELSHALTAKYGEAMCAPFMDPRVLRIPAQQALGRFC